MSTVNNKALVCGNETPILQVNNSTSTLVSEIGPPERAIEDALTCPERNSIGWGGGGVRIGTCMKRALVSGVIQCNHFKNREAFTIKLYITKHVKKGIYSMEIVCPTLGLSEWMVPMMLTLTVKKPAWVKVKTVP